ncbi:hypothetical protein EJ05DRAFT_498904 [Pseudovirgaria hyperparasitica]|uniref:Uncharacterized protein n=1 Tax=Pseudovirgaria hyperparasitica TaxID=470096 RepID=A0A6A6WA12_9PEZI|nr:uncharacterized protein EJ05DRAFT_498904 [Pseudovirgaria hyperparasitica]KAF2759698.1 hypothetical protein EJ05DRAFT_498904 [Pseudovirgaria hyperparasitica]
MSDTWKTVKPIAYALGPTILLSYGPTVYRALFSKRPGVTIRPVPPHVARAQNILFVAAVVFLIACFPYFAPENIYHKTSTTFTYFPTADIFERLADFRSPLTDFDQALKANFISRQCRMVYAAYGPEALANCSFCNCDHEHSYFYYSVASLAMPHLLNTAILGLVTYKAGKEGMRWRTWATILSLLVAAGDIGTIWNFDVKRNDTKLVEDVDFLHWNMRTGRFAALFLLDIGFYALIHYTSTNRWLAQPPSISERLEEVTKANEILRQNMNNLVALRNTVMRDPAFRDKTLNYWTQEERLMGEIMEEPEVVEGVNEALTRVPVDDVKRFAAATSGLMFQQLDGLKQRKGV